MIHPKPAGKVCSTRAVRKKLKACWASHDDSENPEASSIHPARQKIAAAAAAADFETIFFFFWNKFFFFRNHKWKSDKYKFGYIVGEGGSRERRNGTNIRQPEMVRFSLDPPKWQ